MECAKPSFKTILKTLQAEAYHWTGSPLEGTTYEPLLIPYVLSSTTIYLPLEARYRSLTSRQEQATFVVPQTGERVQGSLLADDDLYFRIYMRHPETEALMPPYSGNLPGYESVVGIRYNGNAKSDLRLGFNLALAKGQATRDEAQAVETFWRNDRAKHRYNMNSLSFGCVLSQGVAANQL